MSREQEKQKDRKNRAKRKAWRRRGCIILATFLQLGDLNDAVAVAATWGSRIVEVLSGLPTWW